MFAASGTAPGPGPRWAPGQCLLRKRLGRPWRSRVAPGLRALRVTAAWRCPHSSSSNDSSSTRDDAHDERAPSARLRAEAVRTLPRPSGRGLSRPRYPYGRTETRRLRGSLLHQFELRFRLMQSEQSLFSGGLYRGTTRLGAKAAIVGRLMGELTGRPSWLCPVERKSLPCEGPRRREPWGARGSLRVRGRGQGTAQRPGERASGVRHRARDPGLDARDLGRGTVPLGGHCRAGHTPGNCLFSA